MVTLGFDVGGSGVRGARVSGGQIDGPIERTALKDRSVREVTEAIAAIAVRLAGDRAIEAVGIAVPGFVQRDIVLASPNFPDWRDVDLASQLRPTIESRGAPRAESAGELQIGVENDANAAAYGAWVRRGRRGGLVLVTLGTGVGGGIVVDGGLLRGAVAGGELGHIPVMGHAPCGCGGVGCLETWVSTKGLVRLAKAHGFEAQDGEAVVTLARAGHPAAWKVVRIAGEALGRGLVTLVNLFSPGEIVITGGLALAQDVLGPPAEAFLRRHGVGPNVAACQITWEGRAEEYAIIGACAATSRSSR